MGVKDHLEDGTGHILSLGLDLDYLHVEGAERYAHLSAATVAGSVRVLQAQADAQSSSSTRRGAFCAPSTCSSRSSCSNLSEESAVSDSDDERLHNACGSEPQNPQEASSRHLQESSSVSQAVLGAGSSPAGDYPQPESLPPAGPATDYRSKVEFALKLGYSEELVLLVLRKLGPGALINDILGELVKLGTKTEVEQQGASTVSQFHSSLSSSLACSSSLSSSASSLDSCQLHRPSQLLEDKENLRPVVVDGSNVAMSHGNKEVFSCQGIQLAVDWFLERGHQDITVFVPAWRKEQSRPDALITDQEILRQLEKEKILVFTPSRRVQGRRVVCYDDRFIVKLAYESDGIIVSNDNYRDLANEKPEWKKFIDERLLMYSFVNDKFMPPDDPLGRHGPSLENFLRKRPVIPEHRKQPCPYGKKCTYGHKCKFYHPERGSQPQRSVADELRASAKMSSVATRGLLEDALMAKSQSCSQSEGTLEAEQSQGTPKKQANPSPRGSLSDLLEDRLRVQAKAEGRRGSSSSSSSCSSSFLGHQAAAGSTSSGSLDRWEHLSGGSLEGSSRVAAAGPTLAETYHRCESPDLGYSSLVKAYSSLSLVVPQSPECFYPADLRAGSLPSDCSSEGSVSSDSFSPDPLLDDGPKCYHPHHHPHHHHHCPGQCSYPTSRVPPGFSRHPLHGGHTPHGPTPHGPTPQGHTPHGHTSNDHTPHGHTPHGPTPHGHTPHGHTPHDHTAHGHTHHGHTPQVVPRPHAFAFEESQPSVTSHAMPRALKSSSYVPPIPQHSLLGSFPGEFQTCPPHPSQSSPVHGRSQNSLLGHSAMGSLWQDGGLQEPQMYKGSPLRSGRIHCEMNQQHQIHWDPRYQSSPKPRYDPFAFQSLPEAHDKGWYSPWGRKDHPSPHGLSASSLPPLPQLSLPPVASPRSHLSAMPQHQEPPALAQYQELKERVFVNLCRIFPSDLVRMVMARKPHVVDAQELAAAILMEKSQHSS